MKLEQYLLGEKGVDRYTGISCHASIGFYAMKAQERSPMVAFVFRLLHLINMKKRIYSSVYPSRNMGLAYKAKRAILLQELSLITGDNIMQSNSFNPYFIKSELLVY